MNVGNQQHLQWIQRCRPTLRRERSLGQGKAFFEQPTDPGSISLRDADRGNATRPCPCCVPAALKSPLFGLIHRRSFPVIARGGASFRVLRAVLVVRSVIAAEITSCTLESLVFEIDISSYCAAICEARQHCASSVDNSVGGALQLSLSRPSSGRLIGDAIKARNPSNNSDSLGRCHIRRSNDVDRGRRSIYRRLLLEDPLFSTQCGVWSSAQAGKSSRAGPVFDIIEPRAKRNADQSPDFPGILGPPQTAGMGTTHVLEGTAVTVLKETGAGDSRGAPGYVLEMSGSTAAGTKYASLHHLIVIPCAKPRTTGHAQQKAYRLAGLKAAVYLARAAMNETPVSTYTFEIRRACGRQSGRTAARRLHRPNFFPPEKA